MTTSDFKNMVARMSTAYESRVSGDEPLPNEIQAALDNLILTARRIKP